MGGWATPKEFGKISGTRANDEGGVTRVPSALERKITKS